MYPYDSEPGYQTKSEPDDLVTQSLQHFTSCETLDSNMFMPLPPAFSLCMMENWAYHYNSTSHNGWVKVLSHFPQKGPQGAQLTVNIEFRPMKIRTQLRLVMGNLALSTMINDLNKPNQWQLQAIVPPYDVRLTENTVPVAVQVLDSTSIIIDAATFGSFLYTHSERSCPGPVISSKQPSMQMSSSRNANEHQPPKSSLSPTPTQALAPTLVRRSKSGDMTANLPPGTSLPAPSLKLKSSLKSLCMNWRQAEVNAGRRLVRFCKIHEDTNLVVSCEAVMPDEYSAHDTVVSCILSRANSEYYITSVDVIYLLERLTGQLFLVEEKNRIRRNLEGLRPETVSRNSSNLPDLFAHIMDLPDPKPRNIEKDLKVFKWELLGQALEKILSKYVCVPNGENPASGSNLSDTSSSDSETTPQLPYSPSDEQDSTFHPVSYAHPTLFEDTEMSTLQPVLVSNTPAPTMEDCAGWLSHLNDNSTGIDSVMPAIYSDVDLGLDMYSTYLQAAYVTGTDIVDKGDNLNFAELSDTYFNHDQFTLHY
ncbi:hypothetical protein BDQ12DRAFT_664661 [Crucibulum laeve]|uniref:DUF7082 domain-containing protein n=1 Tax=Crucibulum laeve TaxID=68775 RepID=A0A5C3M3Z7_9AGAR|nr:hypothetical protein BDQ12DRAFT_664661 [Crucibulum laeve]